MDIEAFRDYCLSLPGATEKMPFQAFNGARSVLVFYVGGKMFCLLDIDRFDTITIKHPAECIDELKATNPAVHDPFNLSNKYWIGVQVHEVDDATLREWVRQSYELVRDGSKKRVRK
ncbi:MAG: MmcQ/YjbR family DNA-binding protein [Bacteroidales bacterium]|nr:MmcQ/YjbR family DNA-binding protein [Bacteroidales bacterium]